MKVSFFENVKAKVNLPVSLAEVLVMIQNGHSKGTIVKCWSAISSGNLELYDKTKRTLPCFTASGVFENGHSKEELKEYNPIIILDIDKVGLKEARILKEKAIKIKYTYAAFVSPSNRGLKILAKTNSTKESHEEAFVQIKSYFEDQLNVKVDKSGKDYSRLCYLSYDQDLYFNEYADIYELCEVEEGASCKTTNSGMIEETDFQRAVGFTEKKEDYVEGNRNNFIHLLACNCNRLEMDKEFTLKKIIENHRGLTMSEIKATVNSAFSNVEENGTYLSTTTALDSVSFSKPTSFLHEPLLDSIAYYEKLPEPSYIWGPIVEGSFGYIYGPAGVGKTIFCETLGISVALGKDSFLSEPIINTKKRRVLFVAMEEYGQFSRKRNKKQIEFAGIKTGGNLMFDVSGAEFPEYFNSENDWQKLEKVIMDSEAEVVFIDSMTRATDGQIEDSVTGRQVSIKLRGIAKKHNISLIVIHHSTKLNGNKIGMDNMAGSRVIAQEADFVIAVNMSDNVRYIKEIKSRYKPLKEEVTVFKINEHIWLEKVKDSHENYIVQAQDNREKPEKDQIILDTAKKLMAKDKSKIEVKKVQEALSDDIKQTEFYRRLKRLSNSGKLNWDSPYISFP